MKTLKIETFIQGTKEETVKVPLLLAKVALAPFLNKLNDSQAEILSSAVKLNDYSGVVLEVEEHKISEKVVFSICY